MSKRTTVYLLTFGLLVFLAIALAACSGAAKPQVEGVNQQQAAAPTAAPVPTCPAAPACPVVEQPAPSVKAPNEEAWAASPHNAADSEVFHHWDETADKKIPVGCAKCHSTAGYQEYTASGKIVNPVDIGGTITCDACHNDAASKLTSVTFNATTKDADGKDVPVVISGLGPEARCMVCHQGTASKTQVDAQIAKFNATDAPDTVVQPLKDGDKTTNFGFINVHYFASAITLYGSEVHGGYEYPGKLYDVKFDHVPGKDTCVGCHDAHTTEVKVAECAQCHDGVKTVEDLKTVREPSSTRDYNGNGDVEEGMYAEVAGLRDQLYKGIQAYAKDVAKAGILYDAATYPYFLLDANNDGQPDKNDQGGALAFNAWTPRLLEAAYNYQVSVKDPGAYAHGNKYIVQLLYDSLEDLNTQLATKIDMSKMARDDAGHFAGNSMAFRDWDAEGEVPGTCSRCHSAAGLPQYLKEGVNSAQPTVNGFQCSTCHDESNFPAVYTVNDVTFPSGAKATFGEANAANLCIECHQGRESTVSVQKALAAYKNPDEVNAKISFRNVHYLAAGATLFGSTTQGMFQYANKEYVGQWMHDGTNNNCLSCHDKHALEPNLTFCKGCHGTDDPTAIRMTSKEDFNGNGDTKEGLKAEVDGFQTALYAAIQAYAKDVSKVGILYDTNAYPYFFVDANNDGQPDVDDKGAVIRYNAWTPRLSQAAYNLQYSYKDTGAYVHNAKYVMQALYDSIADLKTKVPSIDNSKLIRPK